jgi:hypothetical protein
MAATGGGAPLYELPTNLMSLDAVRGTVFFLDWRWLRTLDLYDRYVTHIQPAARAALLDVTTGEWVPVELLHAHYRALDAMGLTREQAMSCGVSVGEAMHGPMLRTIVKLAGHLGATPWSAIGQAHKLWSRSWRGGGIFPTRLGDKAARLEFVKNPASRSAFHRGSVAGAISVGIGWLCKTHTIREIDAERRGDSFVLHAEWV